MVNVSSSSSATGTTTSRRSRRFALLSRLTTSTNIRSRKGSILAFILLLILLMRMRWSSSSRAALSPNKPIVQHRKPLSERYITLWLHQVHRWFGKESDAERKARIRTWLTKAREQGFTAVMGDLPWEWTEREAPGKVDIDSFDKDWMSIACELGLKLHIVLVMREFPPWVDRSQHGDYFEQTSPQCHTVQESNNENTVQSPSSAHDVVWKMLLEYTTQTTKVLLQEYGSASAAPGACIASISPTLNNAFETRYAHTQQDDADAMRDYSPAARSKYKKWQLQKSTTRAPEEPLELDCQKPVCQPLQGTKAWHWLGFREEFLAERYMELCRAIKTTSQGVLGTTSKSIDCLLRFGEMLSTADHLNSNLFFRLAKAPEVDHLVMNSNMMLSGAPASPSVVGVIVSAAAMYYGKTIHFEVATEHVLPCNEDGQLVVDKHDNPMALEAASLLLRSGVSIALSSGIHSLGVANLCEPDQVSAILPLVETKTKTPAAALQTASSFEPTALVFVPYRVFYAFSSLISGIQCDLPAVPCWHESFQHIPFFGHASVNQHEQPPGTCPADMAQNAVIEAWDDLRTRHAHVAIVGDASMLTDDNPALKTVTERVLVWYPCLMKNNVNDPTGWKFYEGAETKRLYEAYRSRHPFKEHVAHGVC